ncbi:hypothetical protein CN899_25445 [Bacillus thuringiensis]|uniref:Uncharacterized protein n=1 Tax=Bacillus thuringiensis TaxID=1428 RepID=A0A9X7BVA7_BACTU|nr:hypothetical protein CN899_25445 [Bacillus thuringiensis]
MFLCINRFLCVNTDKKEEKERFFMMVALKNHRDYFCRKAGSQDDFLRAIETGIRLASYFTSD